MNAGKCLIGACLAGLGFVLVMVCVTAAQTPDGSAPKATNDAAIQNVPYTPPVPQTNPNRYPNYAPAEGVQYVPYITPPKPSTGQPNKYQCVVESPAPVGRFQALSHDGKLFLLDTTSGACWVRTDAGDWNRAAPAVIPSAYPAAKAIPASSYSPPGASNYQGSYGGATIPAADPLNRVDLPR